MGLAGEEWGEGGVFVWIPNCLFLCFLLLLLLLLLLLECFVFLGARVGLR
jgi:hypothetical protein